jgi:phage gpG-like protein
MGNADFTELNKTLGEILSRADNPRPALEEIAPIMSNEIQTNFDDEGRPEKWPVSKRVQKHGGQTLTDTAALRHSLLTPQIGERSIMLGSNLPYAALQLFGGVINRFAHSEIFIRNRTKLGRFKKGTRPGKGSTVKEYSISIPAHNYLYFAPQTQATFAGILKRYVMGT